MKPKKHLAQQLELPGAEDVVKLALTIKLRGEVARAWRQNKAQFVDMSPSDGQLAEALITKGLRSVAEAWNALPDDPPAKPKGKGR